MSGKRNKRSIRPYVVGICGSSRESGNTGSLLDMALEGAASAGADVRKIFLNGLAFKGCQECYGCYKTGICVLSDDMRYVYEGVRDADAVIIASPVFFGTVTAQLKAMIDRFHCLWIAKHVLKKKIHRRKATKGYFICSSDSPDNRYFTAARKVVRNLFATLDIEYSGELFCGCAGKKGRVNIDGKARERALRMGKESALRHDV